VFHKGSSKRVKSVCVVAEPVLRWNFAPNFGVRSVRKKVLILDKIF
jgi:hypothetical protein